MRAPSRPSSVDGVTFDADADGAAPDPDEPATGDVDAPPHDATAPATDTASPTESARARCAAAVPGRREVILLDVSSGGSLGAADGGWWRR